MKKIYLLLCLLLFKGYVFAQLPQALNYQAVARNANGTLLTNTNIGLQFSILDGGPGGNPQFVETHAVITNQFGLFVVNIGQGTLVSGAFSAVTWYTGSKYLKVEMDATGGSNYTLTSTSPLLSVPFALVAERLSTQPQLVLDDLIDVYTPPTPLTGQILKFNGVTWNADSDLNTIYIAGSGLLINSDTLVNTGDTDPSDDMNIGTVATGDLRGTYPNPEVSGLLGRKILDSIPTDGSILKWDSLGNYWLPAVVSFSGSTFTLPYSDSVQGGIDAFAIKNTGTGNAAFFTSDSGNALITGNGSVGIGTLTPLSKLDVNGDINTNGKFSRTPTGTANLVPIVFGTVDGAGNIYPDASTSNFSVAKVGLGIYDISINGELFDITKFAVSITLADGYPGFTSYSSFNNTLEIITSDISGLSTDRIFSFQVYKK